MAVTIKDIARIAGVSIATVSRVVNNRREGVSDGTRERVKDVIKQYDYHTNSLAKSMITKQTKTLGLILPDVSNPYFADIAKNVETEAGERGYSVFLCNSDEDLNKEKKYIQALAAKSVDGLLLIAVADKQSDTTFPMPVVLIDRSIPGEHVGVYVDNTQASYRITESLIQAGHTKLAYMGGVFSDYNAFDRFVGFARACEEYKVHVLNENKFFGPYTLQYGLDFAERISQLNVTACVCGNDLIALGLIAGLKNLGKKVPEDISVTGFDDILLSSINNPSITTVKQPVSEMCKVAVEVLINMINGKKVESRTLQATLVLRDSSRRLQHK